MSALEHHINRVLGDSGGRRERYWRPGDPDPEPWSCNGAFWDLVVHLRDVQLASLLRGGEDPGNASEGLITFRKQLRKLDFLDREQAADLSRQYERGDFDAKAQLIRAYLGFAANRARRHIHGQGRDLNDSYEDAIQAAAVGLIRAAEKFDHRKGFTLATYAGWWIKKELQDAEADRRPRPLRNDAAKRMAKVRKANAEVVDEYGRIATDEELVDATGILRLEILELKGAIEIPRSLDESVSVDANEFTEEAPLVETIPGKPKPRDRGYDLPLLLTALTQRQRQVIELRYGLDGAPRDLTGSEIGQRLGISRQAVQKHEKAALAKLAEQSVPEPVPTPDLLEQRKRAIAAAVKKHNLSADQARRLDLADHVVADLRHDVVHDMETDSDGMPYGPRKVKPWPGHMLRTRQVGDQPVQADKDATTKPPSVSPQPPADLAAKRRAAPEAAAQRKAAA
jgi:RNA polymerase primary sigma factor